jgi:CheY-like chemotaxis protein
MKTDNPCILVVDDENLNIQILTCYFKRTKYEIIIANTGEEALEKMKKAHPDLVLLDIQMPGIDGIEVLRTAKSIDAIKDMPIIMLTAFNTSEYKTKSLELGATAFLTKSVNFQELLTEINKAFDLTD